MLEILILLNIDIYLFFFFFLLFIYLLYEKVLNKYLYVSKYLNLICVIICITIYIYITLPLFNWYIFDYLCLLEYLSFFYRFIILIITFYFFFLILNKQVKIFNLDIIFLLFLSCNIFLFILISFDLFLLFLLIEIISLIFYIVSFGNGSSVKESEAGLKYFILGIISSLFLLYGLSFIYGFFGTLNFSKLLILININKVYYINNEYLLILMFAISFILSSFFFKLGIFPFHVWMVDVYVGIPFIIFIYFSLFSKIIFIILSFKLLIIFFKLLGNLISLMCFISGLCSIIIGTIGMLGSFTLRRFFAYSSISHLGFILISFSINTIFSFISGFFYLIIYIILLIGIFTLNFFFDLEKFGFNNIFELKKLKNFSVRIALFISFIFLSFAGVPPFIGFWSKLIILLNLFFSNLSNSGLFCFLILLINLVGVYGYLRLIAYIYFDNISYNNYEYSSSVIGVYILVLIFNFNLFGGFFCLKLFDINMKLILNFLICYI